MADSANIATKLVSELTKDVMKIILMVRSGNDQELSHRRREPRSGTECANAGLQ